ncbi:NUDIX hydrolase [Nakamurella endophytica]
MRPVRSTVAFANPWMQVRSDDFVREDGSGGTYGVVDKPDFALVVAEQDGLFHLVEQFRYPIRRRSLEFPMGGWPPGKGGTALELAQAELAEETGLTATGWRHLGRLYEAPGFCSQGFDVFHATGLTPGPHAREETEADMEHRAVDEGELRRLIRSGGIVDATTITAYGLLLLER